MFKIFKIIWIIIKDYNLHAYIFNDMFIDISYIYFGLYL